MTKVFIVDTSVFDKLMKMEMTIPPPEPQPFGVFFDRFAGMPVIHAPSAILCSTFDCGPSQPEFEFAYLFPLNRRAYKRRR